MHIVAHIFAVSACPVQYLSLTDWKLETNHAIRKALTQARTQARTQALSARFYIRRHTSSIDHLSTTNPAAADHYLASNYCTMNQFTFIAIFAIVAITSVLAQAQPCYRACKFRFCDQRAGSRFNLGGSTGGRAFSGSICLYNSREDRCECTVTPIGHIDESDQAYFVPNGGTGTPQLISKWRPAGLIQPFSPSFFKAFPVGSDGSKSGVGHERPQGNQANFLGNNRCFIMPIRTYQTIVNGVRKDVTIARGRSFDLQYCVAFTTV